MGSRLRENPSKVFDCFVEIVIPQASDQVPWVLQKYPDSFSTEEVLKSVPHFCYPCDIKSSVVQVFSFVLTGADGKWTFGYCRHTPNAPTAICLLSSLPWHETFYELLNRIAEITHRKEDRVLLRFLEGLYRAQVPSPGGNLIVPGEDGKKVHKFSCSDHTKLPSIPENRNLSEYFNAVDAQNMMIVFASMLNERRIVIASSKLSRLSACVQSANALIYPMHWQHIFIPILPTKLIDYLSAPMPFLIGVPTMVLENAPKLDLSEVVVLYADQNKTVTPFDDLQNMPPEIVSSLKRRLKNSTAMLGERVARAFLHSLVQLIGGYRDALKLHPGERITFDPDAFIQSRTPSMQPFLQRMLELQIFQQFIEERLEMLNSGEGFCDEFEHEVNLYADKNSTKLRHQYKEWMNNMKKEGGAFLKSVKNKTNPAVKQAYKSVKDRSKKAYKEVRSKIQELQQKEGNAEGGGPPGLLKPRQPRSAPSSPTLLRTRPVTFHGLKPGSNNKSVAAVKFTQSITTVGSPLTPRQYNLLEVSENSDDAPPDENSTTNGLVSRGSSPTLNIRRISMDLMGDLQDLIFRRCSVSDSSPERSSTVAVSTALPPTPTPVASSSNPSVAVAHGGFSCSSNSYHFSPKCSPTTPSSSPVPPPFRKEDGSGEGFVPVAPPRSKRRSAAGLSHNKTPKNTQDAGTSEPSSSHQEDLLIQLDGDDLSNGEEEIFDPLLMTAKESTAIDNTNFTSYVASPHPSPAPRTTYEHFDSKSIDMNTRIAAFNSPTVQQRTNIVCSPKTLPLPSLPPSLFPSTQVIQSSNTSAAAVSGNCVVGLPPATNPFQMQQLQRPMFQPGTSTTVTQQPFLTTSMQRFPSSNPFVSNAGNTGNVVAAAGSSGVLYRQSCHPAMQRSATVLTPPPKSTVDPFASSASPPPNPINSMSAWDSSLVQPPVDVKVTAAASSTAQHAGWETFN